MRWRIAGTLAAAVTMTAACARGDAAVPGERTLHEVTMRSNAFTPRDLTVALGDTVTWRNADIVRHNAVLPDRFDTGDLRRGEAFDWVPADTGRYAYRCTIHQRMRGVVTVVSR